jgi:hypothetical protein
MGADIEATIAEGDRSLRCRSVWESGRGIVTERGADVGASCCRVDSTSLCR